MCVCVFVCVCVQVIAYMMKEYQMALTEAKKLVKSIRGCINPNDGFMGQLRSYEGILTARLAHGALHTHTHTHTHYHHTTPTQFVGTHTSTMCTCTCISTHVPITTMSKPFYCVQYMHVSFTCACTCTCRDQSYYLVYEAICGK